MLIETFITSEKLQDHQYKFVYTDIIDDIKIGERASIFNINPDISATDSFREVLTNQTYLDLFAECAALGKAFNDIYENDSKFGVKKKHSHLPESLRIKFNQPKCWIEYLSGERRFATVYTKSEDIYRNVMMWHSIPNHYLIRCFDRLLRQKTNYFIALQLENDWNENFYDKIA